MTVIKSAYIKKLLEQETKNNPLQIISQAL